MTSKSEQPPVVTIDGPGGSGKGSVGKDLADRLGWHFLDSGALYRVLALLVAGNDKSDPVALRALAAGVEVQFDTSRGAEARVLLQGQDVTDRIRSEDVGRQASTLAAEPAVRQGLLEKQRFFRQFPGLVADGRDMGTAVFPDAILKIFLTASSEIRAQRRHKQLKEKGFDVNLSRLIEEIRERDARDANRPVSPLKPADDALIVDCSAMTIAAVVDAIEQYLRRVWVKERD